jgi:hypothetical protein
MSVIPTLRIIRLTLVRDLPYQPYQSLPHGLSDGSELFSITLDESLAAHDTQ